MRKRLIQLFVFVIFVLICSCESESYKYCKVYDLCDSTLFISFTIDGQDYKLDQNLKDYDIEMPSVDSVHYIQNGIILGKKYFFFNDDIGVSDFRLLKKYSLDELECDSAYSSTFDDSVYFKFKSISNENYFSLFADTLFNSYEMIHYVADDDYSWDSTAFINKSEGFIISINYASNSYSSFNNHDNYYKSICNTNSTSFLYVTEMKHYRENIYILKGEFSALLFDYYNSEDTILLENGKFKLMTYIPY